MGSEAVRMAIELARSDNTADFGTPASDALIAAAEEHLSLRFTPSYREFLKAVGWCSFGGREFYGITPRGLEATGIPSAIFATLSTRADAGLPAGLLLVEDSGGEEMFVLDTTDLDSAGEAPVKAWTPGSGPSNGLEVVATDFGTHLLRAAEAKKA